MCILFHFTFIIMYSTATSYCLLSFRSPTESTHSCPTIAPHFVFSASATVLVTICNACNPWFWNSSSKSL